MSSRCKLRQRLVLSENLHALDFFFIFILLFNIFTKKFIPSFEVYGKTWGFFSCLRLLLLQPPFKGRKKQIVPKLFSYKIET